MVTGCSREEKIYHTSQEIHHLPQTAPAALLWLMIHQLLLEQFSSKKHACFWLQCNNILYTNHAPRIEVLLMYAVVYGGANSCTQERKRIVMTVQIITLIIHTPHGHRVNWSQISSKFYDFIKELWDSQSSLDTYDFISGIFRDEQFQKRNWFILIIPSSCTFLHFFRIPICEDLQQEWIGWK